MATLLLVAPLLGRVNASHATSGCATLAKLLLAVFLLAVLLLAWLSLLAKLLTGPVTAGHATGVYVTSDHATVRHAIVLCCYGLYSTQWLETLRLAHCWRCCTDCTTVGDAVTASPRFESAHRQESTTKMDFSREKERMESPAQQQHSVRQRSANPGVFHGNGNQCRSREHRLLDSRTARVCCRNERRYQNRSHEDIYRPSGPHHVFTCCCPRHIC